MFIDAHCHLTDKAFDKDRNEVIERARLVGVEKMVVASSDLVDAEKVVRLVRESESLWGLVGMHPEAVIRGDRYDEDKLKDLLDKRGVVGIGEIGLDFHWDKKRKSKDRQIEVFRSQLRLAVELDVPVVIHMREAETEMMEILQSIDGVKGQFHCWSGSNQLLELVIEKGFYVSWAGNVSYPGAENLRLLVQKMSLDRLVLETDSPYLTPEGRRGERNEPENVIMNARFLADLMGISEERLAEQTSRNAEKLFRI